MPRTIEFETELTGSNTSNCLQKSHRLCRRMERRPSWSSWIWIRKTPLGKETLTSSSFRTTRRKTQRMTGTVRLSRLVTVEKPILKVRIGMLSDEDVGRVRNLWNEKFRL